MIRITVYVRDNVGLRVFSITQWLSFSPVLPHHRPSGWTRRLNMADQKTREGQADNEGTNVMQKSQEVSSRIFRKARDSQPSPLECDDAE